MLKHLNLFKWLGWLFAPIQKNGAFFVFMFVLGWLCTQHEIMPYYLRNRGALPYELSAPELFFDLYGLCVLLTLIPRRIRIWVKALLYILLYSIAVVDMYCYERFESTLTPTMLMLVAETSPQEAREFLSGYLNWEVLKTGVGWILLLALLHLSWTIFRKWLKKKSERMILPKPAPVLTTAFRALLGCVVAWLFYDAATQVWDNKEAMRRLFSYETIGPVEHELTKKDQAKLYVPVYRLAFSI